MLGRAGIADGDLIDKVGDAIEAMERAAQPPVPEPLHEWKESDWTFDFRFLEQIRNSGPRDCFMPSLEGIECALLGYEQVTGRRLAETKGSAPDWRNQLGQYEASPTGDDDK